MEPRVVAEAVDRMEWARCNEGMEAAVDRMEWAMCKLGMEATEADRCAVARRGGRRSSTAEKVTDLRLESDKRRRKGGFKVPLDPSLAMRRKDGLRPVDADDDQEGRAGDPPVVEVKVDRRRRTKVSD